VVGPGRNTFAMAKSLAQLDRLSAGRLLLTFVAGVNDPLERTAQGWPTGDRTGWFDTELPRLRALWAGDEVDGLRLDSAPTQSPLEVWLGGQTPAALARVGRIADGWLPGALTIDQAVEGKVAVDHAAADADRAISPEHFGINLSYTLGDSLPAVAPRLRAIGDTTDVIAIGRGALRALVGRWVEAGFSKIVVRPIAPPTDWTAELAALAEEIDGLQT
jgi:alkanesulfonate monooxygenase SsuD/methylene tetrahydromethanopterin reductase-like flavin-dependent oxidoreductase (luciferase family)